MAKELLTFLLDAYAPEHNLVARGGQICTSREYQNLPNFLNPIQAAQLSDRWQTLPMPEREEDALTLYGDTFECEYFNAVARFYNWLRDSKAFRAQYPQMLHEPWVKTGIHAVCKPIPECVDMPLAERIVRLEKRTGTRLNFTATGKPATIIFYGRAAEEDSADFFRDAFGNELEAKARSFAGFAAAVTRGCGINDFNKAWTPDDLVALSKKRSIVAIIALEEDVRELIRTSMPKLNLYGGVDRIPILALAEEPLPGGKSYVADLPNSNFFLWVFDDSKQDSALSGSSISVDMVAIQAISKTVVLFLEHAVIKPVFHRAFCMATLPAATEADRSLNARLGSCLPAFRLNLPPKAQRKDLFYLKGSWDIPWSDVYPEITFGYDATYLLPAGESSRRLTLTDKPPVKTRLKGWFLVVNNVADYGPASIEACWKDVPLAPCRWTLEIVPTTAIVAAEMTLILPQTQEKTVRAQMVADHKQKARKQVKWVRVFAGTAFELETMWFNPHNELMTPAKLTASATPHVPTGAPRTNPEVILRDLQGRHIAVKTHSPGLYDLAVSSAAFNFPRVLLEVLPLPEGLDFHLMHTGANKPMDPVPGTRPPHYHVPEEGGFTVVASYRFSPEDTAILKAAQASNAPDADREARLFEAPLPDCDELVGANVNAYERFCRTVSATEPHCVNFNAKQNMPVSGTDLDLAHFILKDRFGEEVKGQRETLPVYHPRFTSGKTFDFTADIVKDVSGPCSFISFFLGIICGALAYFGGVDDNPFLTFALPATALVNWGMYAIPWLDLPWLNDLRGFQLFCAIVASILAVLKFFFTS